MMRPLFSPRAASANQPEQRQIEEDGEERRAKCAFIIAVTLTPETQPTHLTRVRWQRQTSRPAPRSSLSVLKKSEVRRRALLIDRFVIPRTAHLDRWTRANFAPVSLRLIERVVRATGVANEFKCRWFACHDGKLLGFLQVHRDKLLSPLVSNFPVLVRHRATGIGLDRYDRNRSPGSVIGKRPQESSTLISQSFEVEDGFAFCAAG